MMSKVWKLGFNGVRNLKSSEVNKKCCLKTNLWILMTMGLDLEM